MNNEFNPKALIAELEESVNRLEKTLPSIEDEVLLELTKEYHAGLLEHIELVKRYEASLTENQAVGDEEGCGFEDTCGMDVDKKLSDDQNKALMKNALDGLSDLL